MSTNTNHNDDQKDFQDLFSARSEEKEIKHDSLMLMAAFLSEIEYAQEQQDISRAQLANKIKISPSYLTQVFRSKKPLNFVTLAKIKRALNLRFEIKAFHKTFMPDLQAIKPEYKPIQLAEFAHSSLLSQTNDVVPTTGSIFHLSSDYREITTTKGEQISSSH